MDDDAFARELARRLNDLIESEPRLRLVVGRVLSSSQGGDAEDADAFGETWPNRFRIPKVDGDDLADGWGHPTLTAVGLLNMLCDGGHYEAIGLVTFRFGKGEGGKYADQEFVTCWPTEDGEPATS